MPARSPGGRRAARAGAATGRGPRPARSGPIRARGQGGARPAGAGAPLGLLGVSLESPPSAGTGWPDGAELVRILALALGAYWALRGLWRSWRSIQRYDALAAGHGFSAGFVRRSVFTLLLRATLLDPLNLALLALLTLLLFGLVWPR